MFLLTPYAAPRLTIVDQLRRSPLFSTLPLDRDHCLAVLRKGGMYDVPSGVEIVAPGDPAAFLMITNGALCEPPGARCWQTGDHLGLAEAMAGAPFASTVCTVAPTLLYRLDGDLVADLLTCCPVIAHKLLNDAGDRQMPAVATGGLR
jgi:CRP-like cAMP-binding protein